MHRARPETCMSLKKNSKISTMYKETVLSVAAFSGGGGGGDII